MGNRLRELRKKAGLTLQQVAEAVGTTNQQVGMLEWGQRGLTLEWMERLAPVFNVTPQDLIATEQPVPIVGYVGAGTRPTAFSKTSASRNNSRPPHRPPRTPARSAGVFSCVFLRVCNFPCVPATICCFSS